MRALVWAVALTAGVLSFVDGASAQDAAPRTVTGRAAAVQADQVAIGEQQIGRAHV